MPLLLRKIKENRWFKTDETTRLLGVGDAPSDPLGDLATTQSRLSVFEVAGDGSNIERIVRALAVSGNHISDTGYVLFNSDLLEQEEIAIRDEGGATPDTEANSWHRDLIGLSARKLVALTRLIFHHGETGRVLKKRLNELIEEGIQQKQLPERFRTMISK
jgi:hypothetical protein